MTEEEAGQVRAGDQEGGEEGDALADNEHNGRCGGVGGCASRSEAGKGVLSDVRVSLPFIPVSLSLSLCLSQADQTVDSNVGIDDPELALLFKSLEGR